MARQRRYGVNWFMTAEIRERLTRGESAAGVRAALLSKYPNVNRTQLNSVIRDERADNGSAERLLFRNAGAFTNTLRLFDCEDTASRVRVSLTLSYTNPRTGRASTFGADVDLLNRGQTRVIVQAAVDAVRAVARSLGYDIPNLNDLISGDRNYSLDIGYVRCI